MTGTARFSLPFLSAGQAQKEALVNENMQALDLLVEAAVEDVAHNDPPATPSIGQCFLTGPAPTGDWSSHANSLAGYTEGGWRFVLAAEGMSAYVKPIGQFAVYRGSSWEVGVLRGSSVVVSGQQVVGSREPAIASPSGGSIVDSEARTSISSILSALRNHGLIEG